MSSPALHPLVQQTRDHLEKIGYRPSLLIPNYSYSDLLGDTDAERQITLAAHAQEPTSYRTACLGIALTATDDAPEIARYRALGAPQILSIHAQTQRCSLWTMTAHGAPNKDADFPAADLTRQITSRSEQWQAILRAKNISFPQISPQLDFFDAGLTPTIEAVVHQKLSTLLSEVAARSQEVFEERNGRKPDTKALFRLIFRLITAKVLGDRGHPGDWLSRDTDRVLAQVRAFYFPSAPAEPDVLDAPTRNRAWDTIRNSFHFQNLSVEALVYVYENTFVDKTVRKEYGTHATPYEIAEFAVGHLPITTLTQSERTVFEPFCGAATFLRAARSRLRADLPEDWTATQRHAYFVRMLSGMEMDTFAREIAIESLILTDYPSANGWDIIEADVFASPDFDKRLAEASIVLCNPPYGSFSSEQEQQYSSGTARKEIEALRRVLQHPPQMLAFVLPLTYHNGKRYQAVRQKIEGYYGSVDMIGLPDTVFRHAGRETILILAHAAGQGPARRRFVSLSAEDYKKFRYTRRVNWEAPSLDNVWQELSGAPTLSSVAEVHRGVEYAGFNATDPRFVSPVEKSGFVPGLADAKHDVQPYLLSQPVYLTRNIPFRYKPQADWSVPKIVAPAARLSRGNWLTAAMIDYDGLLCTQRFHGIWGKDAPNVPPMEVIAATINGPVANAWLSTQRTSGDNQARSFRNIPLPRLSLMAVDLITRYVDRYISRGGEIEAILKIDAAVLDAYGLSEEAERNLLTSFEGASRPGVPDFTGYGPDFDRAKAEYRHDLAQAELGERHQALVEKSFLGGLTPQEEREKERLNREIDQDSASFYEPILQELAHGR